MAKISVADLPPVARTLLIPLAYRAIESRRPDAMICDPRAIALVQSFDEDFMQVAGRMGMEQVGTLMRARQFDHDATIFLARHPRGVVVDIGCGLDTRFDRIDNTQMDWYGLDMPEVIAVRRMLLPTGAREHLIGGSATDPAWMDALPADGRPVLFLSEGVFPYLDEAGVRRLVLGLRERFAGAELVFDALTTLSARWHSHTHAGLKQAGVAALWGLDDGRALEGWAEGIQLLEEWHYFDHGEPRLGLYNLIRFVPPLANAGRILRYRLG